VYDDDRLRADCRRVSLSAVLCQSPPGRFGAFRSVEIIEKSHERRYPDDPPVSKVGCKIVHTPGASNRAP
jgi:hypothetical protein